MKDLDARHHDFVFLLGLSPLALGCSVGVPDNGTTFTSAPYGGDATDGPDTTDSTEGASTSTSTSGADGTSNASVSASATITASASATVTASYCDGQLAVAQGACA